MSNKFLAEDIRKIANTLNLLEADSNNDTSKISSNTDIPLSDIEAETSINDIMTHEKKPEKLQGSIAIKDLAKSLGIQNTTLFASAFNALRQGKIPSNQSQVRELAIAFYKLLAADASTTSKVLNQFRRIHKVS